MRSRLTAALDAGAVALALGLALLAGVACLEAPGLGGRRTPLLACGCAGAIAALGLCLPGGQGGGRARGAVAAAALLLSLGSCIVLILVCAVATGPVPD